MCDLKRRMRREGLAARRTLGDQDRRSRLVLVNALGLPEVGGAETLLIYVDSHSEVRTRSVIPDLLGGGQTVVVPWCRNDEHLDLFHLRSLDELAPGRFGILEPHPDQLADRERHVDPRRLDALLLPGVAFDRRGGRLGHGRGYFDRLLAETRPDAIKVGLAFACQLVAEAPMADHDVRMDVVVTEERAYRAP